MKLEMSPSPRKQLVHARIPSVFVDMLDAIALEERKNGRDCNRTGALHIVLSHGFMTLAKRHPKSIEAIRAQRAAGWLGELETESRKKGKRR